MGHLWRPPAGRGGLCAREQGATGKETAPSKLVTKCNPCHVPGDKDTSVWISPIHHRQGQGTR